MPTRRQEGLSSHVSMERGWEMQEADAVTLQTVVRDLGF
jgi:hypothetical protein